MALKPGDFIEIEYTGTIKGSDVVFDTTDEKKAKESSIYVPDQNYGPIIICLGQRQLLKGLDDSLNKKEAGKRYIIELATEKAFGKKNAKMVQMLSAAKFKEQKVQPQPGMQINIDGMIGLIKSVGGGRVIVDFNHPLAGKDVIYDIKVNKIIEDTAEKIRSIIKLQFNLQDVDVKINDGIAKVDTKGKLQFPEEIKAIIKPKLLELVPELKDVKL